MKNYPEAMEYYAKAYHTADSLHKAEVETELSELSIKYENQEKELEIARLTQQHLEQKAKTMQWRLLLLSCCWLPIMSSGGSASGKRRN